MNTKRVCHIREFTKRTLLVFAGGFLMLLSHRNAYADYAHLQYRQLDASQFSLSEEADITQHMASPTSQFLYINTYVENGVIGVVHTYNVPPSARKSTYVTYSCTVSNLNLNTTYTAWMENIGVYDPIRSGE